MMESLTTIPESPKKPNIDKMVRSIPSRMWPKMAPMSPKGIAAMTTNG